MPELLLELLSEEIPARMQERAAADLSELVGKALSEAELGYERITAFATPRRLTLRVQGLPARLADVTVEKRGPRVGARKEALDPPINVVPHLRSYNTVNDAQTSKVTLPFMTTVFDDYDQMAARSGLDYTVVGRSIILFDTHTVFYTTPVVTQADFLGDVTVSVYGVEGATSATPTLYLMGSPLVRTAPSSISQRSGRKFPVSLSTTRAPEE